MELRLPNILNIPPKLMPLVTDFDRYRYFLIEGGRAGAKSQSIARFLLYIAEKYTLRITCGREVQNSIQESVYTLLSDIIRVTGLNFHIFANRLTHKLSTTTVNFRGFREHGRFNIQGMEGVDVLWIDESQAITQSTLDTLIPTIRKDTAKLIFSMNRHVRNDPVFKFLYGRPDCLHIKINYPDNPYCPLSMIQEAEHCRERSEKDYRHIWLGDPLDESENAVFSADELYNAAHNEHPLAYGFGQRLAGFDVARYGDDTSAAVILQQQGAVHWSVIDPVYEWKHADLNYTTGKILQIADEAKVEKAVIDEDGIGAGPLDTLNHGRGLQMFSGFSNVPYSVAKNRYYGNARTEAAYIVKKLLSDAHLFIPDEILRYELETAFFYTFDHYQRRILIDKETLKKQGIPSPNRADALLMAATLTLDIVRRQQAPYQRCVVPVSHEENLIANAGFR